MSRPPRDFQELVGRPSPWLDGSGPKADLVVSTRVRLARNLAHVPFTHRARDEHECHEPDDGLGAHPLLRR